MRHRLVTTLIAASLVVTACGGDDDAESSDAPEADADTSNEAAAAPEPADEPAEDPAEEPAAAPESSGDGSATLTLDNGETYEFTILCSLEPQMAAGSEILFTAVSYDDPSLDITQFGDDGTVQDLATVSVYDAESYDTLWEASSIFEAVGGSIELALDGSTIRGSGSFYPGADIGAEPVDGTVEARC